MQLDNLLSTITQGTLQLKETGHGRRHARWSRSVLRQAVSAVSHCSGRYLAWSLAIFGLVGILLVLGQFAASAREDVGPRHYASRSAMTVAVASIVTGRDTAVAQVDYAGCPSTGAAHSSCHAGAAVLPKERALRTGQAASAFGVVVASARGSPVKGDMPVPRSRA